MYGSLYRIAYIIFSVYRGCVVQHIENYPICLAWYLDLGNREGDPRSVTLRISTRTKTPNASAALAWVFFLTGDIIHHPENNPSP